MFNAVETLIVTVLDDVRARRYNYVSNTDGLRKEGVGLQLFGLIYNEEKKVHVPIVISFRGANESHEFKAGDYQLEAPSSFFKRQLVSGVAIFNISFAVDSDKVVFKPVKSSK